MMTADTPTPTIYVMVCDDDLMVTLDASTLQEAMMEFARNYIDDHNDNLNAANDTDYISQTARIRGINTGVYELPYALSRDDGRSRFSDMKKKEGMHIAWRPYTVMPDEPACRGEYRRHRWCRTREPSSLADPMISKCYSCGTTCTEYLKKEIDGEQHLTYDFRGFSSSERRDKPTP